MSTTTPSGWTEDPGGDDRSCAVTVGAKEADTNPPWAGVRTGDGSTDGDVFGRSNARRVGGERCVDSNSNSNALPRRRSFFRSRLSSYSSLDGSFDVRRLHRGGGAGQTVESARSRCARVNINCQRDQIVGLAAPVGKIATVAATTCGRSRSASTIYAPKLRTRSAPDPTPMLDPRSSRPFHSISVSPHSPSVPPAHPRLRAGLPNMTVSLCFVSRRGTIDPPSRWRGACGVAAAGGAITASDATPPSRTIPRGGARSAR